MYAYVTSKNMKIGNHFKLLFLILISIPVYAERLSDQDVTINSGDTQSFTNGTIFLDSGGPYTINNEGNIISTSGHTLIIKVQTDVTNSGLIDANTSTGNAVYTVFFQSASETSSLNNSGTIFSDHSGKYTGGIVVESSRLSSIINTDTGTIQAQSSTNITNGIRITDSGSYVADITNAGTISASSSGIAYGITALNSSDGFDTVTNTGTITAIGGGDVSATNTAYGIVMWGENSYDSVINSGTIQASTTDSDKHGLGIRQAGTLVTLTNSGTITGSKHGVSNTGTITNLNNTGTITGTSGYSIYNTGTITNLANSQNNLTITNNLPTNYSVIINSASDYGKVTFSSPSGSLNFAIDSSSSLTTGTYSAVMSGITASNIASVTSGSFELDGAIHRYSLNNSTGTQWDLVINTLSSATDCSLNSSLPGCQNTDDICKTLEVTMNRMTQDQGYFAHMNTYDCDIFGDDGYCMSYGARRTKITNPSITSYSSVITFGKKETSNFRWSIFSHFNHTLDTPSNFTLKDKIPLVGGLVVWNENADKSGLQIKVGNTYSKKTSRITRIQSGASEEATGDTVVSAESYLVEARYNITKPNGTQYSSFVALRNSVKKQNGYTEKSAEYPVTYNDILDKSNTIIVGLKYEKDIYDIILKGSAGLEHDFYHTVDRLAPTAAVSITTVNINESFDKTRPVLSLGIDKLFTPTKKLSATYQYQKLPYRNMSEKNLYLNYSFGF
jgi:hypothetical protein